MNVEELILRLEKSDKDATVFIEDDGRILEVDYIDIEEGKVFIW